MLFIVRNIIGLLLMGSLLTACALFQDTKENKHEAVCNQLKHQIIWNGAGGSPNLWGGATGDQVQSTQARAQTETLQKNYHDEGCD